MPLRFTRRILDHLAHPGYRPSPVGDVQRDLRVDAEDQPLFAEAIERLESEGRVELDPQGVVRLPSWGDEAVGGFGGIRSRPNRPHPTRHWRTWPQAPNQTSPTSGAWP